MHLVWFQMQILILTIKKHHMAKVKFITEKNVQVEVEYEVKDGTYYIGSMSGISEWGKYYRIERIDIKNLKVKEHVRCLYLDSIEIIGRTLQHGMDKYDFEKLMKIETGTQVSKICDLMEFVTENVFLDYYNQTMANITKRLFLEHK